MKTGQTAFIPQTWAIYTGAVQRLLTGRVSFDSWACTATDLGMFLLTSSPFCTNPSTGRFTACSSHRNSLNMDSSEHRQQQARASSPPHLTFYQVCKFLGTKKKIWTLSLLWSFAYAQRKMNNAICCSGERIPLCLLFPDPATSVLRIFWKPLLGNCNHSKAEVYRFCLFSPENSIIMRPNANRRFQPPKSYLFYWADSSQGRVRAASVTYLLDTAEGRYLL